MLIAKVKGNAVASAKHRDLQSTKLMLVCRADPNGNTVGDPFLAVDIVGAGEGELVIITTGSAARMAFGHRDAPVDAAITGILDSVVYESEVAFRKE